ncbi:hypothetical protein NUSPORA_00727 [Nucleospora cyclopteri]
MNNNSSSTSDFYDNSEENQNEELALMKKERLNQEQNYKKHSIRMENEAQLEKGRVFVQKHKSKEILILLGYLNQLELLNLQEIQEAVVFAILNGDFNQKIEEIMVNNIRECEKITATLNKNIKQDNYKK